MSISDRIWDCVRTGAGLCERSIHPHHLGNLPKGLGVPLLCMWVLGGGFSQSSSWGIILEVVAYLRPVTHLDVPWSSQESVRFRLDGSCHLLDKASNEWKSQGDWVSILSLTVTPVFCIVMVSYSFHHVPSAFQKTKHNPEAKGRVANNPSTLKNGKC